MRYVSYMENGRKKYGWVRKRDLLNLKKERLDIVCEDGYGGARGITLPKEEVTLEKIQKQGPIGIAYFGNYVDENDNVIGKYQYKEVEGLKIYKKEGSAWELL